MVAFLTYDPIVRVLGVSPHGVGIAVGFLVGARFLLAEARKRSVTEDDVYALLFRAFIGAIAGARLFWVLRHPSGLVDDPLMPFKVWEGGLTLLGGIAGAVLACLPYMRRHGIPFWRLMDAAAFGLPIGIFIGRIGDLIVADHLGRETSFFLGYLCPPVAAASPCEPGVVVHQAALYDAIGLFVFVPLLWWLASRRQTRFDGYFILLFAAWYGVERVAIDFTRQDDRWFGMTASQWVSLGVALACLWALVLYRKTPRMPLRRSLALPGGGSVDEADAALVPGGAAPVEPDLVEEDAPLSAAADASDEADKGEATAARDDAPE